MRLSRRFWMEFPHIVIATATVLVVFFVGFLHGFRAAVEHSSALPSPSPVSRDDTYAANTAAWPTALVAKYVSELPTVTSVLATWPVRPTHPVQWEERSGNDEVRDELRWVWEM
jgi:hypothetical protein